MKAEGAPLQPSAFSLTAFSLTAFSLTAYSLQPSAFSLNTPSGLWICWTNSRRAL